MKYSKNVLIVFFAIVIILSISFETLYIVFDNQISVLLLMWSPAFAAIVCGNIIKAENKDSGEKVKVGSLLGFRLSKIRYILLGIFIPLVYLLVPYIIYWNMHPENFAYNGVAFGVVLMDLLPITVIGIFYQPVIRTGRRDRLEGIHASGSLRKTRRSKNPVHYGSHMVCMASASSCIR